jgi:hypothetical protein
MRSEAEIREVCDRLGQEPDRDTGEIPALHWRDDTFRYGFLVGKIVALEWVLGGGPAIDVSTHHDFEDWVREQREAAEELRRRLQSDNEDQV